MSATIDRARSPKKQPGWPPRIKGERSWSRAYLDAEAMHDLYVVGATLFPNVPPARWNKSLLMRRCLRLAAQHVRAGGAL